MNYKQTCATKAGRQKAALALREALEPLGCTVEFANRGARELLWEVEWGAYRCFGYFDGASKVGVFLAHWHTTDDPAQATYAPGFGVAAHVDINPHHRRKAAGGYERLEDLIGFTRAGIIYLKTAAELTRSAGAHA